jgi:hypothetical protein
MTELRTSEVLHLAADHIHGQSWIVGCTGWGEGIEGGESTGLCIEGGIAAALGLSLTLDAFKDGSYRALATCPAYRAVADYLIDKGEFLGADSKLWRWNDKPDRTASEVIETLRAAAAIEAAREDAALLAECGRV